VSAVHVIDVPNFAFGEMSTAGNGNRVANLKPWVFLKDQTATAKLRGVDDLCPNLCAARKYNVYVGGICCLETTISPAFGRCHQSVRLIPLR
jgi:hypothetical protein